MPQPFKKNRGTYVPVSLWYISEMEMLSNNAGNDTLVGGQEKHTVNALVNRAKRHGNARQLLEAVKTTCKLQRWSILRSIDFHRLNKTEHSV